MRKATFLIGILLAAGITIAADGVPLDAYPKTSIAEDATATWCGFCPNAYAGLEIVHQNFGYDAFVSVRYYETSGSYGTTETDARNDAYGVTGFPTVIIDGTNRFVGAGTATAATGQPYLSTVEVASLAPAPIRIDIDSFNPATGAISATVTMYSATASLSNETVLFVLVEDNVAASHTHVARDLIYDTITLSGAGSTAVFKKSFVIDPGWNQGNLHAVALVQHENPPGVPREVLQAASTWPQPSYRVRGMVPFSPISFGASSGTQMGEEFTVMNTGLTDTFTIDVVVDSAPAGWQTTLVDGSGTPQTPPYAFGLNNEAATTFRVDVTPSSSGQMDYHVEIDSPNLSSPLTIPFTYFTDDLDVMLVDDDGGDPFELYFTAVLDAAGKSYGVWNRSLSPLSADVATNTNVLIWNAGFTSPSLDADDKAFVGQYLDAGKALFLSGQDVGWDLNENNPDPVWYQTYLHATYIRDDTNIMYLDGVAGDPVSDGLTLHIAGGSGANNQDYPDEIEAADADATEILHYQGDGCGAIRALDSVSKARLVYLGFGFEGIDDAQDRSDLLLDALGWIGPELLIDGFETGDLSAWQ